MCPSYSEESSKCLSLKPNPSANGFSILFWKESDTIISLSEEAIHF
jgi:hypothetical protein